MKSLYAEKSNMKRLGNYDLLRLISMAAVILLHINARYLVLDSAASMNDIESMVNIVTRFSVPCFVMISGAFNLHNYKNREFLQFYKKSFYNIIFPFLLALVILFSLSFIKVIISGTSIIPLIRAVLIGDFNNLWYMFMLCGLYFFTPFIILIKENMSDKAFYVGAFVWIALAVYFQSTSSYLVSYSFGNVFSYMGYYLVGNVLFEMSHKQKSRRAYFYFFLSIILFVLTYYIRRKYNISLYMFNQYTSFFSPLIVAASVFLFLGFSNIEINTSFRNLPKLSFYVYLFHTFVYGRIFTVIGEGIIVNEIFTIFIISLLTFAVSLIVAIVFERFVRLIENSLWERIC